MDPSTRDATQDLFARPFTPAMAVRAGLTRAGLERRVRSGSVTKVLRGVYADAGLPLDAATRAEALGLVLGRRQAAVGRTAAWLHGCAPEALLLGLDAARGVPVELRSVADLRDRSVRIGPVRAEPAVDAAVGLVATTPPPAGLAVLDAMLRVGAVGFGDLLECARSGAVVDPVVRETVARSDGRAASAAESVLRHHWYGARLPTPVPGLVLGDTRVALALPWQRFGVTVGAESVAVPGWTVARLPAARVLEAAPELVQAHLEREFHQHLLTRVG